MISILATEAEHTVEAGVTGGFWVDYAGIMLILPFVAFLLILAFGKRMKNHGAELAIGALAINAVFATVLWVMNMTSGVLGQVTFEIGADAEVGARPRDHDGPHAVVRVGGGQRVAELAAHAAGPGVAPLGTGERDGRHGR